MSTYEYFSERILGPAPLDQPEIGINFWKGFVALIWRLDDGGHLAEDFPALCSDSPIPYGTASRYLGLTLSGDVPGISWPFDTDKVPDNQLAIFDSIEFFSQHVSKPSSFSHHSFFQHNHITSFDRETGKAEYQSQVNQLLRRNGHPYELRDNGQVERIGPPVLDATLRRTQFRTGDSVLDQILETACIKFFDPDIIVRKESLEKLWDAWERIKTLRGSGVQKKESISQILNEVSSEVNFRKLLENEARELTEIGNNFMIRHAETNKTPITESEQVDYLFHRMFSLIWLILNKLCLAS